MSEIPKIFHSLEHDGLFKSCLTCNRRFDKIDEPYIINKVFQGPECVFEFAICQTCREETIESFSEESKTRLRKMAEENPILQKRSERFTDSENHEEWTSECAHCAAPASEIENFTTECLSFGDYMVYDPYPILVCDSCIEKNQKLLSETTQDQWNRFILDNFEGPPADALKPDKVPVLV